MFLQTLNFSVLLIVTVMFTVLFNVLLYIIVTATVFCEKL